MTLQSLRGAAVNHDIRILRFAFYYAVIGSLGYISARGYFPMPKGNRLLMVLLMGALANFALYLLNGWIAEHFVGENRFLSQDEYWAGSAYAVFPLTALLPPALLLGKTRKFWLSLAAFICALTVAAYYDSRTSWLLLLSFIVLSFFYWNWKKSLLLLAIYAFSICHVNNYRYGDISSMFLKSSLVLVSPRTSDYDRNLSARLGWEALNGTMKNECQESSAKNTGIKTPAHDSAGETPEKIIQAAETIKMPQNKIAAPNAEQPEAKTTALTEHPPRKSPPATYEIKTASSTSKAHETTVLAKPLVIETCNSAASEFIPTAPARFSKISSQILHMLFGYGVYSHHVQAVESLKSLYSKYLPDTKVGNVVRPIGFAVQAIDTGWLGVLLLWSLFICLLYYVAQRKFDFITVTYLWLLAIVFLWPFISNIQDIVFYYLLLMPGGPLCAFSVLAPEDINQA